MKSILRLPIMLLVFLSLLALAGCSVLPSMNGGLVIGDNYRLDSGETIDHDLTVIGGNAHLDQDSTVNGDVAVMGGTVSIDGTVNGNVAVMGGSVQLDDHAVIRGSVSQLGGSIDKSESAIVEGTTDLNRLPFRATTLRTPRMEVNFDPITGPMLAFFRALALAALAILVQLFAAAPVQRVAHAVQTQPIMTGGIGVLTVLVAPALLIILGITIILLPVSLLGFLLIGVALVFGWLAVGLVTGQHLARLFKQNWSEPITAGVGTLALSLVASMANLIFCIGWLPTFLISVVGLGAVIVTRFGTQFYISTLAPRPYTPPPGSTLEPDYPAAAPAVTGGPDLSASRPDPLDPIARDSFTEDPDRPQA